MNVAELMAILEPRPPDMQIRLGQRQVPAFEEWDMPLGADGTFSAFGASERLLEMASEDFGNVVSRRRVLETRFERVLNIIAAAGADG